MIRGLLRGLTIFRHRLSIALITFIKKVINLLEKFMDDLVQFFSTFIDIFLEIFQVGLFYIPSIAMFAYYYFNDAHWGWLVSTIVWAVFITLLAFFYGENGDNDSS